MLFFTPKSNSYLEDPDVLAMLAFKRGDKRAFETIMERNYQRIFSFITRMTSNTSAAEDLTQETFIKLYGMAASYQPKAKISTLLFQIARNMTLNYLRDAKPTISMDQVIELQESSDKEQFEDLHIQNPRALLQSQELATQVRGAIEALPENQRMALLLARFENMSYEEIAQTMNTSPKAVKSLLNRAKENLKILLKSHLD